MGSVTGINPLSAFDRRFRMNGYIGKVHGTGGRTRTGTRFTASDFESDVSTHFTTPAAAASAPVRIEAPDERASITRALPKRPAPGQQRLNRRRTLQCPTGYRSVDVARGYPRNNVATHCRVCPGFATLPPRALAAMRSIRRQATGCVGAGYVGAGCVGAVMGRAGSERKTCRALRTSSALRTKRKRTGSAA